MANVEGPWYYQLGEQVVGPMTLEEIRRRAASRNVVATDIVSSDGKTWSRADQTEGLMDLYADTGSLSYHGSSPQPSAALSAYATKMLRQTAPWVTTVAIFLFVSSGLMLIAALFILAGAANPKSGPEMGVQAVIVGAFALLYIVPAIFLMRYGSATRRFIRGAGDAALEQALEAQKSFWKFVAITMIVIAGLYALLLLAVLVMVLLTGGARHI